MTIFKKIINNVKNSMMSTKDKLTKFYNIKASTVESVFEELNKEIQLIDKLRISNNIIIKQIKKQNKNSTPSILEITKDIQSKLKKENNLTKILIGYNDKTAKLLHVLKNIEHRETIYGEKLIFTNNYVVSSLEKRRYAHQQEVIRNELKELSTLTLQMQAFCKRIFQEDKYLLKLEETIHKLLNELIENDIKGKNQKNKSNYNERNLNLTKTIFTNAVEMNSLLLTIKGHFEKAEFATRQMIAILDAENHRLTSYGKA